VLVADDNAVNREVSSELLRDLGYAVDTVVNGREVLRAVAETSYDVILMDCQMPEMNGYDATRELRERGKRTPIIALTAHAMAGERERVLAAGMDDYLAKPLDVAALATLLERWLGKAAAADPPPPPASRAVVVLNPKTRRSPKVVRLFLDDSKERLASLRQAVEAGDEAAAKSQAHSLRGSAISIGATRLAEALQALEHSSFSTARAALARIESEAAAARLALVASLTRAPQEAT
jgi:CheY-like chemotaxis protein/HPt (histidine-containing phosphotransfer) domain-containing protein